jgi:hypothetical protein
MRSLPRSALKILAAMAVGGAIAIAPARAPAADTLTTWDIDSGHSVVEFGVAATAKP